MKVVSMRGVTLDMGQMVAQNEKTVAIGNASMNARGDIVGPGGHVVKRREQIASEYYAANPKAVKQVSLRDLTSEVFASPAEAVASLTGGKKASSETDSVTSQKRRKREDRE